jgi:deoxyribonuclease IV
MITLGAHTFGFAWQTDAVAAFEAIAAAGFSEIQLMATPPHFDPWREDHDRTRHLRAILERNGLKLLALDLASSDINLASPSRDVVEFAVDAYRRAIERAAELGAPWICVGSGRGHALLATANANLKDTFQAAFGLIHAEAARRGIRVILENHPQGLLATATDIERFLTREGYADVDLIYDVANGFAVGEDPIEGLETLLGRVAIVHLSDSPHGQWRHDPIGTGAIDFDAICQLLVRREYDRRVVLEILTDNAIEGLIKGAQLLRAAGWPFR